MPGEERQTESRAELRAGPVYITITTTVLHVQAPYTVLTDFLKVR